MTSAATRWSGFLLEIQSSKTVRKDGWWAWGRTHVGIVTNGVAVCQIRQHGREQKVAVPEGYAFIFPEGFGEMRFGLDESTFCTICVELDAEYLQASFAAKIPKLSIKKLRPQLGIRDEHVSALLHNMMDEVSRDCPSGQMYAQCLSLSLATYLGGRFGEKFERTIDAPKFSDFQKRKLKKYIRGHLGTELRLSELAVVAEVSARQFFRLFGSTFGRTPHRYIVDARINKAKTLLAEGKCLVEVAGELGFSSQSHFSDVFRKETGMSPGRFRRQVFHSWLAALLYAMSSALLPISSGLNLL